MGRITTLPCFRCHHDANERLMKWKRHTSFFFARLPLCLTRVDKVQQCRCLLSKQTESRLVMNRLAMVTLECYFVGGFSKGQGLRTTPLYVLRAEELSGLKTLLPRVCVVSLTVSMASNRDKRPSGRSSTAPAAHPPPPSCEPRAAPDVWHSPRSSPAMTPGKEKKKKEKKRTAGYDAHSLARRW